jgi:hypothetical protein
MMDKTSFENCKPYKIYRRTVCQKPLASKSVLLNGEGTGKLLVGPPLGAARPGQAPISVNLRALVSSEAALAA